MVKGACISYRQRPWPKPDCVLSALPFYQQDQAKAKRERIIMLAAKIFTMQSKEAVTSVV